MTTSGACGASTREPPGAGAQGPEHNTLTNVGQCSRKVLRFCVAPLQAEPLHPRTWGQCG